jgi:hypothetical protein
MNAVFSTKEFEDHGRRIVDLIKEKFPEESTRRFLTIQGLKNGLKAQHAAGVVVVVVGTEDELLKLALRPEIPSSLAIVVILPSRDESLLRAATALRPALIWFDDNSVHDLMSIINRIKRQQQVNMENREDLELSWSEDYPSLTRFLWNSMKTFGPRIQSLAEIVYYA